MNSDRKCCAVIGKKKGKGGEQTFDRFSKWGPMTWVRVGQRQNIRGKLRKKELGSTDLIGGVNLRGTENKSHWGGGMQSINQTGGNRKTQTRNNEPRLSKGWVGRFNTTKLSYLKKAETQKNCDMEESESKILGENDRKNDRRKKSLKRAERYCIVEGGDPCASRGVNGEQ